MPERFIALSEADRRDALELAATHSGRPAQLLDKDVWVVWALAVLFESSFGDSLVFKGGTSLSKAYRAIRRFSEDLDVTLDIRDLIPDLVPAGSDGIPATRSQARKWVSQVRSRLPEWIASTLIPSLQEAIDFDRLDMSLRQEADSVHVQYAPIVPGSSYVRPAVTLEFGARSTGEPWVRRPVSCDAAPSVTELEFPTAHPRVMRVERTFWEKATAVHAYCCGGRIPGERIARHWHDLVSLDRAGLGDRALEARDIALSVVEHKSVFFPVKDGEGNPVDYHQVVRGGLRLVPHGPAWKSLAADYESMVDAGILLDDEVASFDELMEACGQLELKANQVLGRAK